MTAQEFSKLYEVSEVKLYPSTVSDRLVGTAMTKHGQMTVLTKPPFSQQEPVYAYPTEVKSVDKTTGEETISTIIVLSNKAPKEPAMTITF